MGGDPACGEVARLCPIPQVSSRSNLATETQRHRALTDTNKVNTSTISPKVSAGRSRSLVCDAIHSIVVAIQFDQSAVLHFAVSILVAAHSKSDWIN